MMVSVAPISDETALEANEIFGNAMYQGYGQTEILPVAMMGPRQWFAKGVPGSEPLRACGMPLPFAELEIWDENNTPVPPGEAGEIVAKTDGQMQGFWNNRRRGRAHCRWLGEDRRHRTTRCERLHARPRRRHGDLGRLRRSLRSSRSRCSASPIRNGARRRARWCAWSQKQQ